MSWRRPVEAPFHRRRRMRRTPPFDEYETRPGQGQDDGRDADGKEEDAQFAVHMVIFYQRYTRHVCANRADTAIRTTTPKTISSRTNGHPGPLRMAQT